MVVSLFTKIAALSSVGAIDLALEEDDSLQLLQSHVASSGPNPTAEPRPFAGKGRRGPSAHPRADDPAGAEVDVQDAFGEIDHSKFNDLVFTNVVYNNLGGMGPDTGKPEGIRYGNVANVDGTNVDFLLTAEGYNTTQTGRNGLSGEVGIVNMVNNNGAQFKFKFLEAGTDTPFKMGQFHLAFLDLDKGMKGGREKLTIKGYKAHSVLDSSEVVIDDAAGTFSGSVHGTRADNPNNPKMLTDVGARRTVSFEFPAGLTEVPFRYDVDQNFNKRDFEGREFMFAGMTSVYFCKTAKVDLDFGLAKLVYSNVGKLGPDFDKPEGIRYSNVATFPNGRQIDLVVNALTEYKVKNNKANGLSGKFGQVSMMSNTETTFRFTFKEPASDVDAEVGWMYFTMFDIDEGKKQKMREYMQITGDSTHFLTERSLVAVTELGNSKYEYHSTRKGRPNDNPTDPMTLTQRQKDTSVAFLFHNKTTFDATFKVGPPFGYTRNFNFAGQSNTVFC